MKKNYITASEFDRKFEAGEDMTAYLDIEHLDRPGLQQKRMSLTLPSWMISKLDSEAKRIGTSRQSIIKFWIFERLKQSQVIGEH